MIPAFSGYALFDDNLRDLASDDHFHSLAAVLWSHTSPPLLPAWPVPSLLSTGLPLWRALSVVIRVVWAVFAAAARLKWVSNFLLDCNFWISQLILETRASSIWFCRKKNDEKTWMTTVCWFSKKWDLVGTGENCYTISYYNSTKMLNRLISVKSSKCVLDKSKCCDK